MNIRTVTDIDHAIAAACDLHDLRADQTGTIRTPRAPDYDQPTDQPVVEFEAQEDDRGGERAVSRLSASKAGHMAGRVRSLLRMAKLVLDEGLSRDDAWNLIDDALSLAEEEARKFEDALLEAA